jgi:hypothetical protein
MLVTRRALVLLTLGLFATTACADTDRSDSAANADSVAADSAKRAAAAPADNVGQDDRCRDSSTGSDIEQFLDKTSAVGEQLIGTNPEVHDCQRLFQPSGTPPLVALWAFNNLNSVTQTLQPVIGIVARDNGYTGNSALPLQQGNNCLWVQRGATDNAAWKAKLVKIKGRKCSLERPAADNSVDVKVWRTRSTKPFESTRADADGVRWQDNGSQFYIGFKCDEGYWCVAGGTSEAQAPANYRSQKHAWGDHQFLAAKNDQGRWVRTSIEASILPVGNLKDITDYTPAAGQHVATIKIENTPFPNDESIYMGKFNMKVFPKTIKIFIRQNGADWEIRFGEASQSNGWKKARQVGSGPVPYHGTARFRWSEFDDGVWVQCAQGCCGDCMNPAGCF